MNDIDYVSPLIIKNSDLKEQSKILNENIVYKIVNLLSSVAFTINRPVLNFILEKGVEFGLLTDPNYIHPLELKKRNKKKLTFNEMTELSSFLSKKRLEVNIIGLSLIFQNVSEFYIPVRIDNRGRFYCTVDYLNYQGIELAKALLLFKEGEKISKTDRESINYLKLFGANCYGNGLDKKSYNSRVN